MATPSSASVSQALAVRYGLSSALVERMLSSECTLLAREARVMAYIPILAERRLEERLRTSTRDRLSNTMRPHAA